MAAKKLSAVGKSSSIHYREYAGRGNQDFYRAKWQAIFTQTIYPRGANSGSGKSSKVDRKLGAKQEDILIVDDEQAIRWEVTT